MKLLFVSKRRPQQRDLVTRPYGRFHYLPVELARLGHAVRLLLVDHRDAGAGEDVLDGVQRRYLDLRSDGIAATWRQARADALQFRPDWVVACSDAWPALLARRLASSAGARLCVDAYDNYEAYMPWNLPLRLAWRRALRSADAVSVAGPPLAELLGRSARCEPVVVPMAADPQFLPQPATAARAQFQLPADRPLIGYMGSWGAERGTDLLLGAFALLRAVRPQAGLVLSGKPPAEVLSAPGVFATGYVQDCALPALVNAVDVACVLTARTAFGKYSHPAKLCEAMACGTAVAATDTAPVRWMLRGHEDSLSAPGDAQALMQNLLRGLARGHRDYGALPSWQESAGRLEAALR